MKVLKILLGILLAGIAGVIILGIFAKQEHDQRIVQIETHEQEEKVVSKNLIPTLEIFDLAFSDILGADRFWIRGLKGRVKNGSPRNLTHMTIKLTISKDEKIIDTETAFVSGIGAGPGDTKQFQTSINLRDVPKGISWSYQITAADFSDP